MRRFQRSSLATGRGLIEISLVSALTLAAIQAQPNTLLDREYRAAISKHVVSDSRGFYYLLVPQRDASEKGGLGLRVSRSRNPRSIEDFEAPLPVRPPSRDPGASLFSAGVAVDAQDRLHFVWSTEEGLSGYSLLEVRPSSAEGMIGSRLDWQDPIKKRAGAATLAEKNSLVGDIARAPDGRIWLTWIESEGRGSEVAVFLGSLRDGGWESFEVARGERFYPPSISIDLAGNIDLTWSDVSGQVYYLRAHPSRETFSREAAGSGRGYRPVLATFGNRVISAVEGGLAQLEYYFPGEGDAIMRPLTIVDSRFEMDTVHSPRWTVDGYGVPWLFFVNSTRQHIFYSRWLGQKWGPILNSHRLIRNSPRREDNRLNIDRLSVEERIVAGSPGIGLTFSNQSVPLVAFHVIPVPALTAQPGTKVLFLDLKEIQELDGLEVRGNEAHKFSGNPVIAAGGPGEFDAHGVGNLCILKEGGLYRMWYAGIFREPDSEWPTSGPVPLNRVGLAESSDGYDFRKPILGLVPFRGNAANNLLPGLPDTPIFSPLATTGVYRDPHESDPEKRFKVLKWDAQVSSVREGRNHSTSFEERQRWTLFASSDGISWRQLPEGYIRFPAGKPASFTPQSLFFDPEEENPDKKYKAYGFSALTHNHRAGSYAHSPDAVRWTAHPQNPVFDPYARAVPVVRSGKVEQIHDAVVWRHHQYYLALYQYQQSGESMDVELAMSRDGENFAFIQPGDKILSRGGEEEWDADMVLPSVPLLDDDEIKLYYTGWKRSIHIEGERAGGVATLRLDGFTRLQLEENRDRGRLTTLPIKERSATDLYVNVDCRDGYIEVELIDTRSGQPIEGFSREESIPIRGNSTEQGVEWIKHKDLSSLGSRPFQVTFHFYRVRSSPRLYSFGFR